MHQSSKAVMRRLHDSRFATRYFVGDGIDIGAGPDPLKQYAEQFPLMRSCRPWDLEDGDAQTLDTVPDASLDFVHSSHCLEHVRDPREALRHWLRVLKPGGHLIVTIPDEDLFEQGMFPSAYNHDHKWTFTMHKVKSWSAKSINLVGMLAEAADRAQIIKVEQLDATFRFKLERYDQTRTPVGECALEFILRKLPAEELARRGRYPDSASENPPITDEIAPIEDHDEEREPAGDIAMPADLRAHRWKFMLAGAALPIIFNVYQYAKPGNVLEPAVAGVIAGQVVVGVALGYLAWLLWSTTKKTLVAMRANR
jgi:SAM-dependent methyltransferase